MRLVLPAGAVAKHRAPRRFTRPAALVFVAALAIGGLRPLSAQVPATVAADFRVDPAPNEPFRFVAYGDMRFTATSETDASHPNARQALVARVTADAPAAIFLNGDTVWHGGVLNDYAVMQAETQVWRDAHLPVFPALGNYEFSECAEKQCLANWTNAYPQVGGRRWYSVDVGSRLRAIALDTDTALEDGSPQRAWLAAELDHLPPTVDFVFIYLHHPLVADLQGGFSASHNPRSNELALAAYLKGFAARSHARLIVCSGHIHNYERHTQDGILYLVSGGGGAHPVPVARDEGDAFQNPLFPNFHYLRFTVDGQSLRGEMYRLEDYGSASPHTYALRDSFEIRVGG